MKIGVELRQLVPGVSGGIVPHVQGVLNAVFRGHPEHEVLLFCTPANETLFSSVPPQVRRLTLSPEGYYPQMDQLAGEHQLDALFCTYPRSVRVSFPLARQVVFIPDLQHEFFPEFFPLEVLAERRASCNQALAEAGAVGTLSEHARETIHVHPCTRCPDVFLMSPALQPTPPPSLDDLTAQERACLPQRPFFLYPANIWPHKNHRRVLRAFDQLLRHEQGSLEFILTGHPDGWPELVREFPHLPVRHLGYVRRPLLSHLLRRAVALVVFSLFEGFGMPLLDAFHAHTPVVCSNTTSLPEVGGDAVLTCDPLDPAAMCAQMRAVLHDDAVRARLVSRGEERLGLYRWEDSARNLVEACRRVADRATAQVRPVSPWRSVARRLSPVPLVTRLRGALRARLHPYYHPLTHGLTVRVHRFLRPHLGSIWQHAPRPLVVPRRYARTSPPSPAPLISLVTPSYNQAIFLERTLRSVLDQGYPRLEYILQDGGSTDDTAAVLRRYRDALAHCASQRDRGQAHAVNLGFQHATGEILAYLNSDDVLLPGALAYVARYFTDHPEVDVVYGHRIIIDENDREVGRWILPGHDDDVLSWEDYVPQETLFWRRRVWEKAGAGVDESFHFALDWDLLVRFRQVGARFVRLPRFLAAFRVHRDQKTSARLQEVGLPEMRRIRARCHGRAVLQQEVEQHVRGYLRRHVLYHKLYRLGLLPC